MKIPYIALVLTSFVLIGCAIGESEEMTPESPQTTKILESKADLIVPAPIQTEVMKEEPFIKSGPNLYNLGPWINSEPIGALEDLRGNVVLLKFWTFGCVNCIHTLPHVQSWHEKYESQGLKILGIHSPEFAYERKVENVQASLKKYGLTFPVALDNDFDTWKSFNNRYWPAFYLIDRQGNIVYKHFGQGDYEATEERIQTLLKTL